MIGGFGCLRAQSPAQGPRDPRARKNRPRRPLLGYRRCDIRPMVISTARRFGPKEQSMDKQFKVVAAEPWSLTTKLTVGISVALAAVLVFVLYV